MATDPRKLIDGLIRSFNGLKTATKGFSVANLSKSFSNTSKEVKGLTKDVKYLVSAMYEEDKAVDKVVKSYKKYKKASQSGMIGASAGYAKMQMSWYPVKALTLATIGIPKDVIKSYADFSDALTQVRSVGQLTDTQLTSLGSTIREIGVTTKFSATEIAQAATTLAQAGFKGAELEQALKPIALLATATGSNMQTGVDVMTTVIRAYNMSALKFVAVSDILTNAVINSKLSLQDLSTSFSYVASAAAQTGVSFKETVTLLGVLANAGLKASTAATGLRMALLKIAAPTRKAQKVLDRLGISKKELNITERGIKNILSTLAKIDTTDIIDIFGARSANAVLALRNVSVEAITALEEVISIQGNSAAIANEQLLTLTKSWKNLLDKFTELKITTGEAFGSELALRLRATGNLVLDISKHLDLVLSISKTLVLTWVGFKAVGMAKAFSPLLGLRKDIPLLKRGVQDFAEVWKGMGKETGSTIKRLHESLKYSVGDITKGFGGLLAVIGPVIAGIGVVFAGKMAFDWFYETYISAEKFKTAMVESEAAFARMTSDSQALITTLGRLSNLNIGKDVQDLLIGRQQDKLSKDTSSMYDKAMGALAPFSTEAVTELERQKQAALIRIKKIVSVEDAKNYALTAKKALADFLDDLAKEDSDVLRLAPAIYNMLDFDTSDTVGRARMKEFLNASKKETVDIFSEALGSFMDDSVILEALSDARTFVSDGWKSIMVPTSYEELAKATKQVAGITKFYKQLADMRRQAPENSPQSHSLDVMLGQVGFQKNLLSSKLDQFSLSDESIQIFKSELAKRASTLSSAAVTVYASSFKFLGKSSSESYAIAKDSIREGLTNIVAKAIGDGNEVPPELKKVIEDYTRLINKAFVDSMTKKANTKEIKTYTAQIGFLQSSLALLDKESEVYKETKSKLDIAIKLKQEVEDAQAILNGEDPKVLDYRRRTADNKDALKAQKDKIKADEEITTKRRKQLEDVVSLYRTLEDTLTSRRDQQIDSGGPQSFVDDLNRQLVTMHGKLIDAQIAVINFKKDLSTPLKKAQIAQLMFDKEHFGEELKQVNKDLENFYDELKTNFTEPITGMFDNVIEGTESVSDAFKNMAENILKSMAKSFTNQLMGNVANGIFDMFTGGDSSTGAGGGYGATGYSQSNPWVKMLVSAAVKGVSSWVMSGIDLGTTGGDPSSMGGVSDEILQQTAPGSGYYNSGIIGLRESTPVTINNFSNANISTEFREEEMIVSIVADNIFRNGTINQASQIMRT